MDDFKTYLHEVRLYLFFFMSFTSPGCVVWFIDRIWAHNSGHEGGPGRETFLGFLAFFLFALINFIFFGLGPEAHF